ncbi:MAG: 2-oxo-4-hydroxy-4-carboxy-5-ureidoimidazoline decarboxylase [Planctomycetota bacterium]
MLNLARLQHDFQTIAGFTETPGNGATRPTFSNAWAQAVDYVLAQAEAAGCTTRRDPAGNAYARPAALDPDEPVWLIGSHLDSVPHGGDYDGVAGVLTALELLRSAHDDGITIPVELVNFAEEEGPTFGLGMLGSRAMAGTLTTSQLQALTNAQGQTYFEAGQPHGTNPDKLHEARLNPKNYLGLIELHAEQGPGMWRRDQRLAVVRSIAGRRQYTVTLTGEANHAGATAMTDRRDALAAAAHCLTQLEALAPQLSPDAVLTVGRLTVAPNAINVIPDRITFTIDFRAPDDETLKNGNTQLRHLITTTCNDRQLEAHIEQTESLPAQPLNPTLVNQLTDIITSLKPGGGTPGLAQPQTHSPTTVSGALHDAAILAPLLPTVMLFVPSRDGISHNPAEFSRIEDIHAALTPIETLVRQPTIPTKSPTSNTPHHKPADGEAFRAVSSTSPQPLPTPIPLQRLNTTPRPTFITTLAGIYEHSPWVAEAVADRRPFPTLDALHAAMQQAVTDAGEAQQLRLIRAHPDLVGTLAKQGRLTAESTAEQRAAGLDRLTPEEADQFDQYNRAYHARFGFPFIICARQHRKTAILAAFPERLQHVRPTEIQANLTEIHKIVRLRLEDLLTPPI